MSPGRRRKPAEKSEGRALKRRSKGSFLPWGLAPWLLILAAAGASMMEGQNSLGSWLAMLFSPIWLAAALPWILGAMILQRWRSVLWHVAAGLVVSLGLGWLQVPNPRLLLEKGTGEAVRVMTYNIKGCANSDCYSVALEMRRAQPDVILIQEAFNHRIIDQIRRDMPGWSAVGLGTRMIASRYPIRDYRSGPLLPGNPYIYTVAHVEAPGGPLCFICIHNPSYSLRTAFGRSFRTGLGYPIQIAREQDALMDSLTKLYREEEKKMPVVLGGDFNSPPTGIDHFKTLSLGRDAFAEAGWGWNLTFPCAAPIIGIDRIIVGRGLIPRAAWVIDTQASDHRPLMAVVERERRQQP